MKGTKVYLVLPDRYPRHGGKEAVEKAIKTCDLVIDAHLLSDDDLWTAIKELRQAGAVLLKSPQN